MSRPLTNPKPSPSSKLPIWLLAAVLGLATVILYWPATGCGFINFDDPRNLTENFHVQHGLNWESMKWAFTGIQHGYWLPVLWLSHMAGCQMFGLNPWGHHLLNVLLHAANAALVFLLFRQLTGATWRSLTLAALFAWHPLRVESVAWVTERKDVLSGFFGLLSLICYVSYARKVGGGSSMKRPPSSFQPPFSSAYILALLFLALGLMSKPMLVTWPFVMLLLDFWPLKRFPFSVFHFPLLREKLPFFALALGMTVVTFLAQHAGGAVVNLEQLPFSDRAGNALISYCRYLGKLAWPTDLAVFYPHPGHWPTGLVLLAATALLAISVAVVKARRFPFLAMGWGWFIITLLPVIGLTQAGEQAMADRFTYLPSLGILLMVIWGLPEWLREHKSALPLLPLAVAVALIAGAVLTQQQLRYWQDSETLFRHALAVTSKNQVAHDNLGMALARQGKMDDAISHFRQAIEINPRQADAYNNLGAALNDTGQTAEAVHELTEAIHWNPAHANAHYNLGSAFARLNRTDDAISEFETALRLNPAQVDAHIALGVALGKKNRLDAALVHLREAVRLTPRDSRVRYNLGFTLGIQGQPAGAIEQFQEAIRLKPDYLAARLNLGIALRDQGRLDEAIEQFQEVLRLKPDNTDARSNLERTLALKPR